MRVIKVSGHQLDDEAFLAGFCTAVAHLAQSEPIVVVNGGGKSIKALQEALGLEEKKIEGLRVTDAPSLEVAEMVMSGQVNKLLVRGLQAAGLDPLGVSGVDGRLMTAIKKTKRSIQVDGEPLEADFGFVGQIVGVRADLIHKLLGLGLTPVISPISCDDQGQHYNINADEAATAVAQALAAEQLDFVSNVPGVMRDLAEGTVIPALTVAETKALIDEGIIQGGMIPKVTAALQAVGKGVHTARIVNLDGLRSDGGTRFKAENKG